MRLKSKYKLFLCTFLFLLINSNKHSFSFSQNNLPTTVKRIQFKVSTIEETSQNRHLLAESIIEGPVGTDFEINLKDKKFNMDAYFLTDLESDEQLTIQAKLNTKRYYGQSEKNLPLYEQDEQKHNLTVNLDEAILLLPFGNSTNDEKLKIEIIPSFITRNIVDGKELPLTIDIVKPDLNGKINVRAYKIPHRFNLVAKLLADGKEIAKGVTECFFKQPKEIQLDFYSTVSQESSIYPLVLSLDVSKFERSCPTNSFELGFDIFRLNQTKNQKEPIIENGAGAGNFGEELNYDLTNLYLPTSNKKYELKISLTVANNE
ncbi:MAG: hypothetical protein IPK14_10835 [Blastocatellia bacterium]|nr:hypothetical protein [Blastocatellia bacterium]